MMELVSLAMDGMIYCDTNVSSPRCVIGSGVRVRTSLLPVPWGGVVDGDVQHTSSTFSLATSTGSPIAAMWPASGEAYELTPMHCFTAGANQISYREPAMKQDK